LFKREPLGNFKSNLIQPPVLKELVDIDELIPIAVEKEIGTLKFPKIKKLRL